MQDFQRKEITIKFKSANLINDFEELLHISYNQNIATEKYLEDRGSSPIKKVLYWNNKLTEFLNKLKINENEKTS